MSSFNAKKAVETFVEKPHDFNPRFEVAACYIEIEGKLLLLKQALNKIDPGAWGVPAGKLETDEKAHQAAQRELFEETGIDVPQNHFRALGTLYIRKPIWDYVYHLFQVKLEKIPKVTISNEHQAYQWILINDLSEIELMTGAKESIEHYQRHSAQLI